MNKIPKLIAFYFPQFHPIPENDLWWGKGFQDWMLVKNSKPLFAGHNQPRIPLNQNYYNPCNSEILSEQANMAKEFGVSGFMFYHYYFDGKLMLEKPLETLLNNKSINIPFCISWANESWTRGWIGKPHIFLQEQKHTKDLKIWEKHFNYLFPYFSDDRYIKINDMPVFTIYQPTIIPHTEELFSFWNDLAISRGLKGIYYIANKNHQFRNYDFLKHYNGMLKFQPREAFSSNDFNKENFYNKLQILRLLPDRIQGYMRRLLQQVTSYKIIDSNKVWESILNHAYEDKYGPIDLYESAYFEWDNTPRYGNHAKIYTGSKLEDMKNNLKKLVDLSIQNNSEIIFFNAWNEWSESAYLEPDTKNQYDYLNIVKSIFKQ